MPVHEVAAAGFGREARTYDGSRPSYPDDAVAWILAELGLEPGGRVCDLAAGTGIFTRLLRERGFAPIAVEPVDGMRAVLRARLPDVPAVSAVAEALPFADRSLAAVTIAQAFHWFDARVALGELRRVLRVGGAVALVWNARDRSRAWVDAVWSILDRVERAAPWRDHDGETTPRAAYARREDALRDTPGFGTVASAHFHHEQVLDHDGVVARFRGVSHVAALPDAERRAVLDEVRALLRSHPDTRERSHLAIPYRVDAYCIRRIG